MRIDVSEIKTHKTCKRKWKLNSRNQFHMRPKVTPAAFSLGTLFHESLHSLYLGVSLEKVMSVVKQEMNPETDVALLAMIPGYYKNVLPEDLDRYSVLDIEHSFKFHPCTVDGEVLDEDIEICGSIDMVVLDKEENKIYGFEHKTCKVFRDSSFMWMDEQPRVYTIALQKFVQDYNKKKYMEWFARCYELEGMSAEARGSSTYPEKPEPVSFGGIYINEVKKLLRDFKYNRTLCVYPDDDMENFCEAFFGACKACKHDVDIDSVAAPSPSYFNCQMCEFKHICETYMYSTLDKEQVLREFGEEFKVREEDHLDEKVERVIS